MYMKTTRKILAFLVAAATILTAACDKTEKKTEEKKSLSVLLESISFDSVGGVQELGIKGQGENPVFRITKKYVPLNR